MSVGNNSSFNNKGIGVCFSMDVIAAYLEMKPQMRAVRDEDNGDLEILSQVTGNVRG